MKTRTREHFCPNEFCQVPTIQSHEMDYNDDDEFVYGWRCNNCQRWEAKRVVTLNNDSDRPLTPNQERSVEAIRRHIEDGLDDNPQYGDEITKWELRSAGFQSSWFLSVETEMTNLPKTNLLRALDHHFWSFFIGPRGRVEAISYPKSFEQFKGRMVFGFINVK